MGCDGIFPVSLDTISGHTTNYQPLDVFITQDLIIYVKFLNATKVKKIIGIVERLRLRSSNRLTVNVIRNQQRDRRTSDVTYIPSPQAMYMILLSSSVCPSRAGESKLR